MQILFPLQIYRPLLQTSSCEHPAPAASIPLLLQTSRYRCNIPLSLQTSPYRCKHPPIAANITLSLQTSCSPSKHPAIAANIPISLQTSRYRCKHPAIAANIPLPLQPSRYRCKHLAIAANIPLPLRTLEVCRFLKIRNHELRFMFPRLRSLDLGVIWGTGTPFIDCLRSLIVTNSVPL